MVCPHDLRQSEVRHFRLDTVERMKNCEDIAKLAEESGVSRSALYRWKRKAEGLPSYREMAGREYKALPDEAS